MIVAPYAKTPRKVAIEMLKLAKVTSNDVVYDLGCGDGEIVIVAAKFFGCKAIGVEIREDLIEKARKRILEENVADKVNIIHGDLFTVNLSEATVITLYLLTKVHELLKSKFKRELKNGTRIVTHMGHIPGWEPIEVKTVNVNDYPHFIYLYIIGQSDISIRNVSGKLLATLEEFASALDSVDGVIEVDETPLTILPVN